MSAVPQLDPETLKNLAITLHQPMMGPLAALPPPTSPGAITPPGLGISLPPTPDVPQTAQPQIKAPRGTTTGDEAERSRMLATGPGENQIYGKINNSQFGQNHPLLGKIFGGAAEGGTRLLDLGLSAVAPSLAVNLPGTAYHHAALLNGINRQIGNDTSDDEKQAQTANLQAEVPLKQAQTAELPGKTASEEGLQGAQTAEANARVAQGPDLASAYAHAVNQALKNGVDPSQDPIVQHLSDAITSIQKQPLPKGMEKVDLVGPNGKPIAANYDPAKGTYTDAQGKPIANPQPYEKPNQAGMVTVVAPDPNTPGGGIVERVGAGGKIAPGTQTMTGFNTENTPTMQQRTAAGRAATVVAMAPEVLGRIDAVAGKLGPVEGRWNDFMQGKVGTDDPDFAALRSDLLMMSSAVALAHAQGRLPENLREEFDRSINAPKQTPENLKATINTMIPWLQKMQEQGHPQAPGGNTAGGTGTITVDAGGKTYTFKDQASADKFKAAAGIK